MADAQLYEDTFTVTSVNDAKYDRVARISGTSADNLTALTLDINTDLYPLSTNDPVQLLLASTLSLDGAKDDAAKGWRPVAKGQEVTLADMWDYVCYGKVYRFEEGKGDNIKVYVSFGGLLMYLEGPYRKLTGLRVDWVYLLLKR
ncbi:DNA-directed RNA polymerases I [Myriangium duriaei CBS 260.36]|uniref:DNA-directed RNA polymerases I, II, and III subunit RPABC3 n=1 Tax=Myriangium duriaei CBS 260.36 TaxID=1168546 RepID=A0A9P4IS53_9PEZI|nr:DNA-directed RNA polymerases I [Myriangium duriaei CBS 260.36]